MAKDIYFSVVISIGETYCRSAACSKFGSDNDPFTISAMVWSSAIRNAYDLKNSTTLLLHPDKSFHSFGYEAEKNYANMTEDEEKDQTSYYYFRSLHNLKKINKGAKIKDETGKMLPVFDVFVHSIRFMKEETFRVVPHTFIREYTMFMVTFPARWGNNAKPCIREAAEKAGIPRDNLIVVLDPEVAALTCYLPESNQIDSFYKPIMSGASYIVVDLGGRTGDISYHQHNGFLRKLLPTEGRALGGNSVNDEFWKLLGQVYGEKQLLRLKKENPDDYDSVIKVFENKVRFTSLEGDGFLRMNIRTILIDKEVTDLSRFSGSFRVGPGDKLSFSLEQIRRLFEKTLTAIETGIERILHAHRLKGAEYILLVGEFSECKLVQSAIRKRFPQKKVIVPCQPRLAVVKGAALFIFISKTMNSEARCTYGVQHWPKFDKTRHPLDKLVVIDGVIRCKDVFFKYIERGEQIPKNRRISHVCSLFTSSTDTVECTVYASCHRDPQFTDDEGCAVLGVLRAPFTVDRKVAEVEIEQTLIFNKTCITLQAINMETGQVCETQMEYM
ncbi:heat shock 70 kDa protein 12B-like [Mizuhopecten yessoensis]|nr:heat shock 70 kDa protein 12B-like [Mizuhopecten yessoensis]